MVARPWCCGWFVRTGQEAHRVTLHIAFFTNTYLPQTTGLAISVGALAQALRARGHRVTIAAPAFVGASEEPDVIRVPALPALDTGLAIPLTHKLVQSVLRYSFFGSTVDVVHAHGFTGLGEAALNIARARHVPIVFTHHTHHTLYEGLINHAIDNEIVARACGAALHAKAMYFARKVDLIVALGSDIRDAFRRCAVCTPIEVVPNGIPTQKFARGDGHAARTRFGLPSAAFVVGTVSRLSAEKNLPFPVAFGVDNLWLMGDARVEEVIRLGARINELRAELKKLETQLARLVAVRTGEKEEEEEEPVRETTRSRILALLNGDPNRQFTVAEIQEQLQVARVETLRTVLVRMQQDGEIKRLERGVYRGK